MLESNSTESPSFQQVLSRMIFGIATAQAQKVVAHLQKASAKTGADTFVWGKKVEKELAGGKKLKEISVFTDRNRQQERLVGFLTA